MFGITDYFIEQVVHTPGSHSWAIFYIALRDRYNIENAISRWLDRIVNNYHIASVRITFLLLV